MDILCIQHVASQVGPSYRILCKKSNESTYHLLNKCGFTLHIWKKICFHVNISQVLGGENLDTCFTNLINSSKFYHSILAIIFWKIWRVRNTCLFENHLQNSYNICNHILQVTQDFRLIFVSSTRPICLKEIQPLGATRFFDGVAKDGFCVAGVSLLINNIHSFNTKLHCGTRTNMKAELLAF